MCGIMGYTGGGAAAKIVYDGLKRLEYRGYDSAGISVLCGNEIKTVKRLGRVSALGGVLQGKYLGNQVATDDKAPDANDAIMNDKSIEIRKGGLEASSTDIATEFPT